jgi:hypothetical protein
MKMANAEESYLPIHCAVSSKVNETLILTMDALRNLSPAGNNFAWMDNNPHNVNCHHTDDILFDIAPVSDDSRDIHDSSDSEGATTHDDDSEYNINDDCDDSDIILTFSQFRDGNDLFTNH